MLHALFLLLTGESSNPAIYPYLCFVLSHMPALVPALFSTSSSPIFLPFINQPCRLFHHQPETVGYTGESFRNVTTCNVFVIRSIKAFGSLVLVIWYIQTAFPIGDIVIFKAASCYFRVKAFYGPEAIMKDVTFC